MFHVIALTNENKVFAWGKGDYGQLGLGRPGNWDAPMEVIGLSGCASGLGDATSGVKVGRGGGATTDDNDDDAKNYRVTFVAAGGWHSCALTESGTCVMWGRGEYGRLGMGDDQTVSISQSPHSSD
jgi:alpha-tubulin suppressor-like RCC1 family protein